MKLCVGATSRRVVKVAAELGVHQIVASRAQVDIGGGYTGMDQDALVALVRQASGGLTKVVRDHGGPLQGGRDDDGIASLQADVRAGFDRLHLDVCKLPLVEQHQALYRLVGVFDNPNVPELEIGGEHNTQDWNDSLVDVARDRSSRVRCGVLGLESRVWADRQRGTLLSPVALIDAARKWRAAGIRTKAHNMDWVGRRRDYDIVLDEYNIAPEFALVETNALLTALPWSAANRLLQVAYDSEMWCRWFNDDEGTRDDRARCAVRYVLMTDEVVALIGEHLDHERERFVQEVIAGAIKLG